MSRAPFANVASDASDLIHAAASFGWVLLAAAVLWIIRDELRALVRRIRRVDTPIGSADMAEDVRELEEEVDASEAAIRPQLPSEPRERVEEPATEILDLTAREPRLGLIKLVTEIEVRVRDLASIAGHEAPARSPWSVLLEWLVERGIVPRGIASSSELINSVRNRIVHGRDDEIDDREVAASVDAGLRLLRLLDAIPREGYEVATRLLPVYRDADAIDAYEGVHGVVLWGFDARGKH